MYLAYPAVITCLHPQRVVGSGKLPTLSDKMLMGPLLGRSHRGNQSCWEFKSEMVMSGQEDSIPPLCFLWHLYSFCLLCNLLWILDVPIWPVHSALTYSLHFTAFCKKKLPWLQIKATLFGEHQHKYLQANLIGKLCSLIKLTVVVPTRVCDFLPTGFWAGFYHITPVSIFFFLSDG